MALIAAHAKMAVCKSKDALLKALRAVWSSLLTNVYRPELHYMRGPGPRTRAIRRTSRH
jgi:hypothetical protein